jgi:hypothetical protein
MGRRSNGLGSRAKVVAGVSNASGLEGKMMVYSGYYVIFKAWK